VRLNKTALRAPFPGIVGLRRVSPGDYLQPGQDIVNLEAITPIKLDFRIPEIHLPRLASGQRVAVAVDAYPDRSFAGEIYAIDPGFDPQTRTIQLRARMPNPDGALRPGMFARVQLELARREDAILIPEQAIVPKGADKFVYRVSDDKALLTSVRIGERLTGAVEIVEGLRRGDRVVIAGQTKIRDGAAVSVVDADAGPAQAAAGGDRPL
jgi:membrane fusion protein, multidrug efflux system